MDILASFSAYLEQVSPALCAKQKNAALGVLGAISADKFLLARVASLRGQRADVLGAVDAFLTGLVDSGNHRELMENPYMSEELRNGFIDWYKRGEPVEHPLAQPPLGHHASLPG